MSGCHRLHLLQLTYAQQNFVVHKLCRVERYTAHSKHNGCQSNRGGPVIPPGLHVTD